MKQTSLGETLKSVEFCQRSSNRGSLQCDPCPSLAQKLAYSLQLSLYATSLSVHTGVMCNGTKEFLVLPLFGSRHHLPHVPAGARSRTFSCTIPRVVLRRCMCSFAVALKTSLTVALTWLSVQQSCFLTNFY